MAIFEAIYDLLWGDIIHITLPGGSTLGLSLLVLILVPAGIYFTIRTRFLPFRMFPEMIRVTLENNQKGDREGISGVQALIISTACRVGMGNLVGVVAAISAGGAGAVFWMWVIALLGSSTAFIEATLAQLYKEKDPLYGGYRGGPAYYLHHLFIRKGSRRKRSVIASLFALSGLICWFGISQVTANSISSSFENAFHIPPLYSTIALVAIAAVIVLRKNTTVKVLDIIVPIMAPVLAALGFMTAIGHWNQWMTSYLYITKSELTTLQHMLMKIEKNLDFLKEQLAQGQLSPEQVEEFLRDFVAPVLEKNKELLGEHVELNV